MGAHENAIFRKSGGMPERKSIFLPHSGWTFAATFEGHLQWTDPSCGRRKGSIATREQAKWRLDPDPSLINV